MRVASTLCFQFLHLDAGAPLHKEFAIAVRGEPNLHLVFYWRNVTSEMQSPWTLPVLVMSKSSGNRVLPSRLCSHFPSRH